MAQCLKFIVSGDKNDDLSLKVLETAAAEAAEAEIDVEWLTVEDIGGCNNLGSGTVLVCETFEGATFERLRSTGLKIVGPQCVMFCLKNVQPLPETANPVHNTAMLDVVACCTNIPVDKRNKLKNLILQMGGIMVGDFTHSVTHLIAGEVGSKKYQVACEIGKKIMQPAWVYDCWDKNKYDFVNADDQVFKKHLCPCFKGLTISITGMSADARLEIKQLTEQNGGKYSGELNMRTCTHLIVKFPKGEKYNYARQWKIHCVSPQWFFDSVKNCFCQNEETYKVEPENVSGLDESKFLYTNKSRVNMTVQSERSESEISTCANKAAEIAAKRIKQRSEEKCDDVEKADRRNNKMSVTDEDFQLKSFDTATLNVNELKIVMVNNFLDGCKFYVSGIPLHIMNCLRKIINAVGAMRFSHLNENISHIILGDIVSNDIEDFLKNCVQKPFIVSPKWLIDCYKTGKHLNEQGYSLIQTKSNLPDLGEPTNTTAKKPDQKKAMDKSVKPVPSFQLDDDIDDDVFLGQYLPQAESSRISFRQDQRMVSIDGHRNQETIIDFQKPDQAEAIAGPSGMVAEHNDEVNMPKDNIFSGCRFAIRFFEENDEAQIISLIEECGGVMVENEEQNDYIIVPLSYEEIRVVGKKEVTLCWFEQSLEKEDLPAITSCFLFQPFYLPANCTPLKDCVITISQFSGVEREHLMQLADLLGAFVQESFARKAANGMRANTHLLLLEATGNKYEAACKWGVCCVSKRWLIECAKARKMVSVDDFPLETNTVADMNDHGQSDDENATTNQCPGNVGLDNEAPTRIDNYMENDLGVEDVALDTDKNCASLDSRSQNQQMNYQKAKDKIHELSACEVQTKDNLPKVKPRLQIRKSFKPSFDLTDAMEFLRSPSPCFSQKRKSRASRGSLGDFINEQLQKAFEITSSKAGASEQCPTLKNKQETKEKTPVYNGNQNLLNYETQKALGNEQGNKGVLGGVVIAVSQKLSHRQTDLHNLASLLGADYRYIFDESCTHLLHVGKVTDAFSEVKQARNQKKFIVSDHWLDMCLEKNTRVKEALYPCNYNPKMSLEVVTEERRKTRSMAIIPPKQSPEAVTRYRPAASNNSGKQATNDEDTKLDDEECNREKIEICPGKENEGSPSKVENKNSDKSASRYSTRTTSVEARNEFTRQMEEIMEATKGKRSSTRRSRRQKLQSSATSDETGQKRQMAKRLRSRQSSQKSSGDSSKSSDSRQGIKVGDFTTVGPSQGDVIGYDDPAGRQERERILAQLKAASPSQDIDQEFHPIELTNNQINEDRLQPEHSKEDQHADASSTLRHSEHKPVSLKTSDDPPVEALSTPLPPPINLQITRQIQAPEPVNLLEKEDASPVKRDYRETHKFLLSAMSPQEKIRYSALIEDLGGVVCDAQYFTLQCTHVVVGTPNRNEKFLASVAAGKWVLHKSYLEASREAGYFISEELHEWGTEEKPSKLAAAAHRWRKKLNMDRMRDSNAGAFKGWQVLLCVGCSTRQHGFKRMIEAGGGIVTSINPPFTNIEGVTHAFIDPNKVKPGSIDYTALHAAGIWILRPDYIAEYLTQEPPPPMLKYIIEPAQKLMDVNSSNIAQISHSDSKKRKNDDDQLSQKTKRGRR